MAAEASQYDIQAETFLAAAGLRFAAKQVPSTCPPWESNGKGRCYRCRGTHGYKYVVTLRGLTAHGIRDISFPFWNSEATKETGEAPKAYDVLVGLSSGADCPDRFAEFCSEYGYDEDSRKAEKLFLRYSAFAKELRAFFTEAELSELAEIR